MLKALIDYAGRIHPVIIHFPIAFLIVGAIGEVVGVWYRNRRLTDFISSVMLVGASSAIFAVLSGWLFALQVHRPPEDQLILAWHRWMGLCVLPLILLSAFLAIRWAHASSMYQRWARRGLIWIVALLVSVTAHLGAAVVWGSDFFN